MSAEVKTFDEKKLDKLPIIDHDQPSKRPDKKEEDFLRQYVVCEFNNMEQPGLMQSFVYGTTKNKMKFDLFHGGKYRLPRHIMNHINRCGQPIYKYKPDGDGRMVKSYSGRKNRFMMQQIG